MNRNLTCLARFSAAALSFVAATAVLPAGASATSAATVTRAEAADLLLARPYRAVHLGGVAAGTYTVVPPAHGVMLTLQLSGLLTSSGGCYTAQAGVRRSGVWTFSTVAGACTTTPASYQVAVTAIVSQSPAFGVRVCAAAGACGAVTQLPASGISVPS
jgi:hypothetical protein